MTDFPYEEPIPFRVRENTKQIGELQEWRREVDTERATRSEQITTLIVGQKAQNEKLDGLVKVLIGFAFSIALASVVFALSILAATGKIG